MLYAIVDIETTGGHASGSGITEIAIIIHDGRETLHSWQSLINPERPIPYFIEQLTGINDAMVADAPVFSEVAEHIYSLLHDKIFVAHNVNFDYSFIKHNLGNCGYELDTRKLCSIRLARKVLPGYSKYGLGNICHQLGIPHKDQHRAYGDAHATALLFELLVKEDLDKHLEKMLKGKNKESYLPPNLPVSEVDSLPKTPGVYYFYNVGGKVIYVGKAINLQKRVKSHFSNNKSNRQKQDFLREIYRISHQPTATDLMAHILESAEIRRLWPKYNRSQRGFLPKYALYAYPDQQGLIRLGLDKHKQQLKPIHTFNSIAEGHHWLRRLIDGFSLCARLCNLAKGADCQDGNFAGGCTGQCCEAPDKYNLRVNEALDWVQQLLPTMAIIDVGRHADEQSCILIEDGVFKGMGYLSPGADTSNLIKIRECLELYPDNDFIRNLIFRHASENPEKCIQWINGKMITSTNTGEAAFALHSTTLI